MKKVSDVTFLILVKHWKLVAVFAAAMTLAIAMLQSVGRSVWFDEGYSIMVAQKSVGEIFSLTAVDAHPPVYYVFLKLWASLFGWSELSLRLSSAVIGALGVGAMIALVRKLFSPKVAVAVAPFLVLAPFLTRYDYEIRMYALVAFIGIVATWVLVTAHRSGRTRWWLLYALLVALGMYTLYMSVVFWLAHVVWLAYQSRANGKPIVRQKFWLYYGLAVLLFLPWIPTVIQQLQNSALPPYMTAITLTELVNITGMLLAYNAEWQVGPWLSVGLMIFGVLLAYVYAKVWRLAAPRYRQGLVLLLLGFVVGIVFYAVISLPPMSPRFMERYTVHIAPFAYALVGVVIALGWRLGYKLSAGALGVATLTLLVFGQFTLYGQGNYNFQRLQSPQAKTIREDMGCDQTTYVTSGPYGYIDMWYDFQGCDIKFYYPWDVTLTGGFAPLNGSKELIRSTDAISSKRIIFIYFDDSTDFLTPDQRYKQVGQHDYGSVYIQVYER